MRKILAALLTTFCVYASVQAQSSYYQVRTTGTDPRFDLKERTLIKEGPTTGYISGKTALPFSWNFFGKAVSSYSVSDQGYLLFDSDASSAVKENTALDANCPLKNAIMPFWDEQVIKGGQRDPVAANRGLIYYANFGDAPNRVHAIYWSNLYSGANGRRWYAVYIHEDGRFQIKHTLGLATEATGTVGIINEDGSKVISLMSSPTAKLDQLTGPNGEDLSTDDITFNFMPGDAQPKFDLELMTGTIPATIKEGATQITGNFTMNNWGSESASNIKIAVQVDSEPAETLEVKNVNVIGGGRHTTSNFTDIAVLAPTAGKILNLKAWIVSINDNADENAANNVFETKIRVVNGTRAQRYPLLEEYSGAWCQYCPRGHRTLAAMEKDPILEGKIHPVVVHAYDVMSIPEADPHLEIFPSGYPSIAIDRILFPGEGLVAVSDGKAPANTKDRLNVPGNATIELTDLNFNKTSGQVTVTVNAKFNDFPRVGDYRMNLYVVEDNVKRPDDREYDQQDGSTKIPGYNHRHVLRMMPSGSWGNEGIIPQDIALNTSYSKTYTFELPEEFDVTQVYLYGFASIYDSNPTQHEVLNSAVQKLVPVGIEESKTQHVAGLIQKVYPNPSKGLSYLDVNVTSKTALKAVVYNQLGQEVMTLADDDGYLPGNHTIYFNTQNVAPGLYTIKVATEYGVDQHKIIVSE